MLTKNKSVIIIILIIMMRIIIIIIIIDNEINMIRETRKYWVDVQRGIASSHGERDHLYP